METVIFEKNNVKIVKTDDSYKAYALVYEKSYDQAASGNSDELENLNTFCQKSYDEAYDKLDDKIIEIDSASEKENENDEYSIWYSNNIKYEYNKLFDVILVSANFSDYTESINVIEFDIDDDDFSEFNIIDDDFSKNDIKTIYVSKDCNRSFVGDRKKELVIESERVLISLVY